MNYRSRCLVAVILLGMATKVCAQSEWRKEKDKEGILIESRAVAGWDIREIRATTSFEGRLSSLIAVIDDPTATSRLNDLVKEAKITQRDSDSQYRIYMLIEMPWPLKDRYALMQRRIEHESSSGRIMIIDEAIEGDVPAASQLVRIVRSHSRWTFTPKADGSVLIELRMLSDPSGPIPAALINAMSIDTPFKTLSQLKLIAHEPRYANANMIELSMTDKN